MKNNTYCMCLYSSFMFIFYILKYSTIFEHCLIIILGDFIVDILKDNNHAKNKQKLLNFMDKIEFKS
jgi:hypothetical protein